jgi:hypothetical protein
MSVLGGGAGRFWVLVEDGAGARSAWVARWNVGDRDAADRRIWRVTYGRLRSPRSLRPSLEFAAARGRLERSLQAMLDYTLRCTRGGFRDVFEQALATLRTGERHGYHRDLAPEGALPEPALALLDACQTAWVFGGMGSWADLAVEKAHAREYRRVTAEHDEAVGDAIVAGANEGAG